jgi:hypothetical protein
MTDADKEWGWGGSVQARRLIKSKSFREIAQRRVELVSRDFHGGAGLTEHERQEEEILSDLMGALLQAANPRLTTPAEASVRRLESKLDKKRGLRDRHAPPTIDEAMDGLG